MVRILAAAGLLFIGSLLGGCATSGFESGSTAAPANYRQAVAARMREMVDVSTVKSAKITRPHERFFITGSRPVVCVIAVYPSYVGFDLSRTYLFYFINGRADGLPQYYLGPGSPPIGCGSEPYMPFPELRAR
jgi:hypothetical protein